MSKSGEGEKDYSPELEWIRFREETLGDAAFSETSGDKLARKIKENPFVPIGAFATFGALSYGLWCFRQGRGRHSQMMMRARILAQGFTIAAIMGGFFLGSSSPPQSVAANKPTT